MQQQELATGFSKQISQVEMLLDRFLYLQKFTDCISLRMQSAAHHTLASQIHNIASWHYTPAFLVMHEYQPAVDNCLEATLGTNLQSQCIRFNLRV